MQRLQPAQRSQMKTKQFPGMYNGGKPLYIPGIFLYMNMR
jgi:hypothetical protein